MSRASPRYRVAWMKRRRFGRGLVVGAAFIAGMWLLSGWVSMTVDGRIASRLFSVECQHGRFWLDWSPVGVSPTFGASYVQFRIGARPADPAGRWSGWAGWSASSSTAGVRAIAPLCPIAVGLGVGGALLIALARKAQRRKPGTRCARCGYELGSLAITAPCPECGNVGAVD